MANILLKTLYRVQHSDQFWNPHVATHSQWDAYCAMQDLSVSSFRTHLRGDWELVDIRERLRGDLQRAFRQTAAVTRELIAQGNNVIYADPDTLCVAAWTPWNCYKTMRLFDWQPRQGSTILELDAEYWNCSLRYFPGDTSAEWHHRFDTYMRSWNNSQYGYEQWMYWRMMWDDPQLETQHPGAGRIKYNIPPRPNWRQDLPYTARVLHFAASKDPQSTLADMREIWKQRHNFH